MNNIEDFIKVSEKKVFLAVNKAYFGLGLKAVDLLILSSIEEYTSKDRECYLTNEQFAWITGESISTVKRVLDRLEKELNIIKRKTFTLNNNGQKSKQRKITLNDRKLWKIEKEVQNEPTLDDESKVQNEHKQGSNNEKAGFKNEKSKVQSEPIKSNLRKNKKENLKDKNDADAERDSLIEELEGLEKITLERIRDDYKKNKFGKIVVPYKEIKEKYNLNHNVSKVMIDEIERILNRLRQEEWADRMFGDMVNLGGKPEPVKTEEELEAERRIAEREHQARVERAKKESEERHNKAFEDRIAFLKERGLDKYIPESYESYNVFNYYHTDMQVFETIDKELKHDKNPNLNLLFLCGNVPEEAREYIEDLIETYKKVK